VTIGSQNVVTIVTVILDDREDGGWRAFSDDLAGLILSGKDRAKVAAAIIPAIQALFRYKGFNDVIVKPARPIGEILQAADHQDLDVHVQHGQNQFVVEFSAAA
jgi:hypothetical protein